MHTYKELLKTMMKFRSTADCFEEKKKIVEYIANLMGKAGFAVHIEQVGENYNLFIANTKKIIEAWQTSTPIHVDCGVCCHVDVVPADAMLFEMREEDDYIYGRGSLDMKGATATMLASVYESASKLLASQKTFLVLITTDEETGAKDGIQYIVEKNIFSFDTCIVPDTGEGNNKILNRGKGFIFVELQAKGMSAHGCRPRNGKNAIELLWDEYTRLKEFCAHLSTSSEGFETVSVNLGVIYGGDAPNKIPDSAGCLLDIRFPPSLEIFQHIMQYLEDNTSTPIQYVLKNSFAGFPEQKTLGDHLFIQAIKQHYGDITLYDEFGSNDGRFLVNAVKSLIMMGPKGFDFHAPQERVLREELEGLYCIFNQFIDQYVVAGTKD